MACFTDDLGPMAYLVAKSVVKEAVVTPKEEVKNEVKSAFGLLWEGTKLLAVEAFGAGCKLVPNVLEGRTPLEKKMLLAAGAYACWAGYNSGVMGKISNISGYVVPGYKWVKSRLGKLEVVVDKESRTRQNVLESRRTGSEESEMTQIRSQARVGYIKDDKFVVIGSCLRFEGNYLVGPDHVIGGHTEKWVMGSQSKVSLAGKEVILLATDLVAVKMTEQEMSTIGVAICKLGVTPEHGIFASIVGPEGKGTTGRLVNDPANFGRVIYHGTTLAGYSGSAYCVGTQVLGLHQMGGEFNGGYSSSYAWMCLKLALKERLESSDEWLLGQMNAGRTIKWQNVGDPEEIQVCVDGKYSVVQRDAMERAFGKNWHLERELSRAGESRYDDSHLESADSGEAKAAKNPGASSMSANSQVSSPVVHQNLIAAFSQLSNKKALELLKLARSLGEQSPTMNGQVKEARLMK